MQPKDRIGRAKPSQQYLPMMGLYPHRSPEIPASLCMSPCTFLVLILMCSLQFRFLSSQTPRYLTAPLSYERGHPLILIRVVESTIDGYFLFLVNNMVSDFVGDSASKCLLAQCITSSTACCSVATQCSLSGPVETRQRSSAYAITLISSSSFRILISSLSTADQRSALGVIYYCFDTFNFYP